MPKNILIVNAVLLNNGDAALVLSLYNKLKINGHDVTIASFNYKSVVRKYPNLTLIKALGGGFLFRKIPFLRIVLMPILFFMSKKHRNADIVISAPGGYINSFYNIKSSLQVLKIAKQLNKKTGIYAQSVGSLNANDIYFFSKLMASSIDVLMLRDKFSYNFVEEIKIDKKKTLLSKDAAFMLKSEYLERKETKKVAFSVRQWPYDNRNEMQYKRMVQGLVKLLLNYDYQVTFLSTSQGVDSYKNDAEFAKEIQAIFIENDKVEVDDKYYTFYELYNKLEEFDLIVGTRLHMCILALTKHIPAFNISYEVKGKEAYNYLDLKEFSIDYNEPLDSALRKLELFLKELDQIKTHLGGIIPNIKKEVDDDFEIFYKAIIT